MIITQAGVGSGLDLESIIEAFVIAESIPVEIRLQNKEDRISTELSGIGSLKSALSTFQDVVKKLQSVDDFNEQIITTSTDDISVTTNGFATNGSFAIEVIQLAKGTRIQTPDFADPSTTVAAGTLTFLSATGDTFDVSIDAADDLSTIRDKINNSTDNYGVNVTLVTYDDGTYLSYSSAKTGTDNVLTVSGTAGLENLSTNAIQTTAAQNGQITIDGNTVSSATNEYKNNIEDVTIVAHKVSVSGAGSLDITQDPSVASTLINEFIAGYNAVIENMIGLGAPKQGRLAFDSDLRSLRGQLNNIVTRTIGSMTGDIDSLSSIGILINREGKLETSAVGIGSMASGAQQLSNAIENNLSEVGALFASSDGVVSQLTDLIDQYNDSTGSLTQRQSALNIDLTGIADEYQALEDRLRSYEETLRKRFSYLDSTVARYTATSEWLKTALAPIEKD